MYNDFATFVLSCVLISSIVGYVAFSGTLARLTSELNGSHVIHSGYPPIRFFFFTYFFFVYLPYFTTTGWASVFGVMTCFSIKQASSISILYQFSIIDWGAGICSQTSTVIMEYFMPPVTRLQIRFTIFDSPRWSASTKEC